MGGSYRGLWSLVGHSDNDDPVGIFWIIISAVFHLRTLQVTGYFGSENKAISSTLSSDQLVIGSVLVNILQMLRYNAHSILSQVVRTFFFQNFYTNRNVNNSFLKLINLRMIKMETGSPGKLVELEMVCILHLHY